MSDSQLLGIIRNDIYIFSSKENEIKKLLNDNPTYTVIKLYGNNIGDEGAKAIAKALLTNTTITTVDLGFNSIEAEGAKAIANALLTNTTITAVDLWNNNIGAEGAKAIANSLLTNTTITTVDLGGNSIGAEGAKAIANSLLTNTTITTVYLGFNNIGKSGKIALIDSLVHRSVFVDFGNNFSLVDEDIIYHYKIPSSAKPFYFNNESLVDYLKARSPISPLNEVIVKSHHDKSPSIVTNNNNDSIAESMKSSHQDGYPDSNNQVKTASEIPVVAKAKTKTSHADIGIDELRDYMTTIRDMTSNIPSNDSITRLSHQIDSHSRALEVLVNKTKECPSLIWIYPKERKLRDWLESPSKALFQESMMVTFICPVTLKVVSCGPKGLGWEISQPKEWVKKWGPAILVTLRVLQIAVVAGRILGVPIPTFSVDVGSLGIGQGMSDTGLSVLDNIDKAAMRNINNYVDKMTRSLLDVDKHLKSTQEKMNQVLKPDIDNLSNDSGGSRIGELDVAYSEIRRYIYTIVKVPMEVQLEGIMERLYHNESGTVEWVSLEGKNEWYRQQDARLTTLAATMTTPTSSSSSSSSFINR